MGLKNSRSSSATSFQDIEGHIFQGSPFHSFYMLTIKWKTSLEYNTATRICKTDYTLYFTTSNISKIKAQNITYR